MSIGDVSSASGTRDFIFRRSRTMRNIYCVVAAALTTCLLTACSGSSGQGENHVKSLVTNQDPGLLLHRDQVPAEQEATLPTSAAVHEANYGGGRVFPAAVEQSHVRTPFTSGGPTYWSAYGSNGGSYAFPMIPVGYGVCVIQELKGKFSDPNDIAFIGTDSNNNWTLNVQSGPTSYVSVSAECAPWSLFYNDIPNLWISGDWYLTASNNGFATAMWNNDAYCYLRGVGGFASGPNSFHDEVYRNIEANNTWDLEVFADPGYAVGRAGCFKFSTPTTKVYPTITVTPYVDAYTHVTSIPSPAQALCGLTAGQGGFTNPNTRVTINTSNNTLTNAAGDSNWPLANATCVNFYVP
jgi:hypothetical protein